MANVSNTKVWKVRHATSNVVINDNRFRKASSRTKGKPYKGFRKEIADVIRGIRKTRRSDNRYPGYSKRGAGSVLRV